jgi:hypothetical protein
MCNSVKVLDGVISFQPNQLLELQVGYLFIFIFCVT